MLKGGRERPDMVAHRMGGTWRRCDSASGGSVGSGICSSVLRASRTCGHGWAGDDVGGH
jgi:hypothetical protein